MTAASVFVAGGQLCWKMSCRDLGLMLLAGFFLYGVGSLLMTVSFKYGKLSVVHPWLSTSYVFAVVFSAIVLHETISGVKLLGILLVMAGVSMIGAGDRE